MQLPAGFTRFNQGLEKGLQVYLSLGNVSSNYYFGCNKKDMSSCLRGGLGELGLLSFCAMKTLRIVSKHGKHGYATSHPQEEQDIFSEAQAQSKLDSKARMQEVESNRNADDRRTCSMLNSLQHGDTENRLGL